MEDTKIATPVDVIVIAVVLITGVLLAFLILPSLSRPRRLPLPMVCLTNLKGLGTAMAIYANDYDGRLPQMPGEGPWARDLGFSFDLPAPDFTMGGDQAQTARTITASWYLLVREVDVQPKQLVCPMSGQTPFEGKNPAGLHITEMWDFGRDPYQHVSYSLHNPYGKYPANEGRPSGFAVAADMNPWFRSGDIVAPGLGVSAPQIISLDDEATWKLGNSWMHPLQKSKGRTEGPGDGQNVVFADGHAEFVRTSNCGIGKDNIYTFQSREDNPNEQDIQGGSIPTGRTAENDAKAEDDSFLAI